MNAYRIATISEKRILDIYEDYDVMIGPNGFECILTEPEDRNWDRDGANVITELNRLHAELERVKSELHQYEVEDYDRQMSAQDQ